MAQDCIFCRIANGEIPTEILAETEHLVAFHDVNPQAPVHILIIPRTHIPDLLSVSAEQQALLGEAAALVQDLAKEHGLENGCRLVVNTGEDGGQTVPHLHFHLLGQRALGWPPG